MCAGNLLDQVKLRYDIKTFINVGVMAFSLVEAAFLKHTAALTGVRKVKCFHLDFFVYLKNPKHQKISFYKFIIKFVEVRRSTYRGHCGAEMSII